MLESNQVKNKIQMPFYDLKSPTKSLPYPNPTPSSLSSLGCSQIDQHGFLKHRNSIKNHFEEKKFAKAGSGGTEADRYLWVQSQSGLQRLLQDSQGYIRRKPFWGREKNHVAPWIIVKVSSWRMLGRIQSFRNHFFHQDKLTITATKFVRSLGNTSHSPDLSNGPPLKGVWLDSSCKN